MARKREVTRWRRSDSQPDRGCNAHGAGAVEAKQSGPKIDTPISQAETARRRSLKKQRGMLRDCGRDWQLSEGAGRYLRPRPWSWIS